MMNAGSVMMNAGDHLYSALGRAMSAQMSRRGAHIYADHDTIKSESQHFLPEVAERHGLQWSRSQRYERDYLRWSDGSSSQYEGDLIVTYCPIGSLAELCAKRGLALEFAVHYFKNPFDGVVTLHTPQQIKGGVNDYWIEGDVSALAEPAFLDELEKWHTWSVLASEVA